MSSHNLPFVASHGATVHVVCVSPSGRILSQIICCQCRTCRTCRQCRRLSFCRSNERQHFCTYVNNLLCEYQKTLLFLRNFLPTAPDRIFNLIWKSSHKRSREWGTNTRHLRDRGETRKTFRPNNVITRGSFNELVFENRLFSTQNVYFHGFQKPRILLVIHMRTLVSGEGSYVKIFKRFLQIVLWERSEEEKRLGCFFRLLRPDWSSQKLISGKYNATKVNLS